MKSSWICVDASLIVGLATHPRRVELRALLRRWRAERMTLAAPTLLYYEVANAAFQYERQQVLTDGSVDHLLRTALALPIQPFGEADLHREALALARRLSLPATYDAHYLALAERLDCELWTTDAKLARAVGEEGPRVRLAIE